MRAASAAAPSRAGRGRSPPPPRAGRRGRPTRPPPAARRRRPVAPRAVRPPADSDETSLALPEDDDDYAVVAPPDETLDMDEAEDRARGGSWSFRHLESVMVGAARPTLEAYADAVARLGASVDDDELYMSAMTPEKRRANLGDDPPSDPSSDPSSSYDDVLGSFLGLRTRRGWARGRAPPPKSPPRAHRRPAASSSSSAAAAWETWVSSDDVETLPETDAFADPVAGLVAGVQTWVADRRERSAAARAAAEEPPPLEIVELDDAMRDALGLGADEMHFLPIPEAGWSVALLRYRPTSAVQPETVTKQKEGEEEGDDAEGLPVMTRRKKKTTGGVVSFDAAWDDSLPSPDLPTDFFERFVDDAEDDAERASANADAKRAPLPVLLVPGCASNAYTLDASPQYSLARHLAARGRDAWIVESRGVGFSRPWARRRDWTDAETGAPRQHAPAWGDFDFDTYAREDLPAAAAYVSAVTGSEALAAVGHSMGGMLLAAMAASGPEITRDGEEKKARGEEEEEDEVPTETQAEAVEREEAPDAAVRSAAASEGGGVSSSEKKIVAPLPSAPWRLARTAMVASCLECSDRSEGDGRGHTSAYAKLAGLAGVVPAYLYGGDRTNVQLPLGPLSVGQAAAIEAVKGAPAKEERRRSAAEEKRTAAAGNANEEKKSNQSDEEDEEDEEENEKPSVPSEPSEPSKPPSSSSSSSDADRFWETSAVSLSTCYPGATDPEVVRALLYKGFGNVPLRLVLQMATLFAPGGMATREEAARRRERAVDEAARRRARWLTFRGWGDDDGTRAEPSGVATVADVVDSTMASRTSNDGSASSDDGSFSSDGRRSALYLERVAAAGPRMKLFAADCDPIFPPEHVRATAEAVGAEFQLFGDGPRSRKHRREEEESANEPEDRDAALREMLADGGEHYSHYDLLVGRNAPAKVFPAISAFLEGEEEDAAEEAEEGEASEPSAMRRLLVGTLRTLFAWEP